MSDRVSDLRTSVVIVAVWEILVGLLFSYSGTVFPHAIVLVGPAAEFVDRLHGYANFDAAYYVSIALNGYGSTEDARLAFFPLYPLTLRLLTALHVPLLLAGIAISFVTTTAAGWFLLQSGRDYGVSPARRLLPVWLFLFFPTAYFLGAFYTESTFCALAFGAFWFANRRRWLPACIVLGVLTATRFPSLVVVVAVALALQ
jgi:Gpi18-like mannosyltransferase